MEAPNTAPLLSTEPLDVINNRLKDEFGLFENGQQNYRLVWSNDQFETRFGEYPKFDNSGNYLGTVAEYAFVPKYKQWMPDRWVLEMLIPTPAHNKELVTKLTYEPMHGFVNAYTNKPLDPTYRAIRFLINNLRYRTAKRNKVDYVDPLIAECDPKIAFEANEARVKGLMSELFGNETDTGDALAYKEGVSVPSSYEKSDTLI